MKRAQFNSVHFSNTGYIFTVEKHDFISFFPVKCATTSALIILKSQSQILYGKECMSTGTRVNKGTRG